MSKKVTNKQLDEALKKMNKLGKEAKKAGDDWRYNKGSWAYYEQCYKAWENARDEFYSLINHER